MCKKIISFLLTLMMISGMISIPVMADDTSASTQAFGDEVVIADFTKMEDINNAGMKVDSQNKLFGDKSGTISDSKIEADNIRMDGIPVDGETIPNDWSEYTHLNLWVYSKAAVSDRKIVVAMSSNTSNEIVDDCGYSLFNQNFDGWKKISIDLSEITPGKNFDIKNVKYTWVSLEFGLSMDGAKYEGEELSFAKMWLSKEAETVTDVTKEVYSTNYPDSTTYSKLVSNNAKLKNEVTENHSYALKLTGTKSLLSNATAKWVFNAAEDWSSYNYINMRIKNASTNTDGSVKKGLFRLDVYSESGGYWNRAAGHGVEGSEWQTLSIKIPTDLKLTDGTATSMNDINGIQIVYITGTMYLEKIWLSTEDPNVPVEKPELETISIDDNETVSAYTRSIDFSYSNALDSDVAPTVTVAPEADYVVSCENDTVQVIFPEALAAGTEYTVTVSGVSDDNDSISFSTEKYSAERSDTAVYARYAPSEPAKMFIAVYSADNTLIKVEVIEDTDSNGVLAKDYVSLNSDESAKVFVWADDDTIKPLESPKEFLVDSEE